MMGPQYSLGGFRLNSHIYSLEMAHQLNASFPQVKSKKKKRKDCQLEQFPSQSGHLGKDAMAGSIRALRRRGGNTTERENWKVLHPEHQGEQAK